MIWAIDRCRELALTLCEAPAGLGAGASLCHRRLGLRQDNLHLLFESAYFAAPADAGNCCLAYNPSLQASANWRAGMPAGRTGSRRVTPAAALIDSNSATQPLPHEATVALALPHCTILQDIAPRLPEATDSCTWTLLPVVFGNVCPPSKRAMVRAPRSLCATKPEIGRASCRERV